MVTAVLSKLETTPVALVGHALASVQAMAGTPDSSTRLMVRSARWMFVPLDLIEPVPELIVAREDTVLQHDIAVLFEAGHLDCREYGTVAVAVFDRLRLRI